ncbi:ribonuclease HII [Salegentibacter salegens]|uniref:Ribonuclease HII n=1 Tax=Salegentibacter salegens TaxID=143223 RepID=A0A1M7N9A6_9FLAO|nr:ribonuclease HII [Salegentibacter salegens]PRX45708.1 RNase HII [Salegentibacter salegens]SHN00178.1 RNase HII [Salegentibacter salegens]
MLLPYFATTINECGTDEAGRGCLAGPVTAAAVILPKNFENKLLNDSKQTKLSDRNSLKEIIIKEAITYGIAHVYMEEIDKINILNASILAMHRAIDQLKCEPEHIIVDGNKFKPYRNINYDCIIKGDGKFLSIAAASILAKTARDEFMQKVHHEFPMYNWQQNKGYPTKEHRRAIMEFGSTPYHRKSFKLLPEQLKLAL